MTEPEKESPGVWITYREAVNMFVQKADFDKFALRFEAKIDSLLADRLPKWAWVALGLLASFIAPLAAVLISYFLHPSPPAK